MFGTFPCSAKTYEKEYVVNIRITASTSNKSSTHYDTNYDSTFQGKSGMLNLIVLFE
jgi:hypothetical protein